MKFVITQMESRRKHRFLRDPHQNQTVLCIEPEQATRLIYIQTRERERERERGREGERDEPNAKQKVKKAEKRLPRTAETAKLIAARILSDKLERIEDDEAID